jgi:hypothetical protein
MLCGLWPITLAADTKQMFLRETVAVEAISNVDFRKVQTERFRRRGSLFLCARIVSNAQK